MFVEVDVDMGIVVEFAKDADSAEGVDSQAVLAFNFIAEDATIDATEDREEAAMLTPGTW